MNSECRVIVLEPICTVVVISFLGRTTTSFTGSRHKAWWVMRDNGRMSGKVLLLLKLFVLLSWLS